MLPCDHVLKKSFPLAFFNIFVDFYEDQEEYKTLAVLHINSQL